MAVAGTGVECSPHLTKVNGSSLASVGITGREKNDKEEKKFDQVGW